jgi:putative sugar O-methyltransferase
MTAQQVPDDLALLDRMMADLAKADPLFAPTSYWRHYEQHFMPELRRVGLCGFRRRRRSVLSGFNAVDLLIAGEFQPATAVRGAFRISRWLTAASEHLRWFRLGVSEIDRSEVTEYFYWLIRRKFASIGLDLHKCGMSTIGDPEDVTVMQGHAWSRMYLQYCGMLADAARDIAFAERMVFCELGSGLGRQIEVTAKLFPNATLLLFDIPPQLYVANQYLKTVFGERVLDYAAANAVLPPAGVLDGDLAGRIIVQPTWRLPAWSRTAIDIFWNSASFQEMEPHVVANYLALVRAIAPRWIYINALPGGNYWGPRREGTGGTREAVTDAAYTNALDAAYTLVNAYPTDYFLRARAYQSYVFRRVED